MHTLSFDTFSLVETFDHDVARNSQVAAIKYHAPTSLERVCFAEISLQAADGAAENTDRTCLARVAVFIHPIALAVYLPYALK